MSKDIEQARRALARADHSRAIADAARDLRQSLSSGVSRSQAGTLDGKPGILQRWLTGTGKEPEFQPFDRFWREALVAALARVAEDYDGYAREAEGQVTIRKAER